MAPVTMVLGLAATLAACGPQIEQETGDSAIGSSSSSSSSATMPITMSTSTSSAPMDSTGTTMLPSSTSLSDSTSVGFIMNPDGGGVAYGECDVFAQDCPEGDKCQPWANDGMERWNATRCSGVVPMPGQPEDPCTVEDSPYSGRDDCDLAVLCFDVDPKTLEGTCYEMCAGSHDDPTCSDPDRVCSINYDSPLALCLLPCDPLAMDCPDDLNCVSDGDQFVCVPTGTGGYGDECDELLDCAAGLSCVSDATAGCADHCCTDACDPMMPDCMDGAQACQPVGDAGVCAN